MIGQSCQINLTDRYTVIKRFRDFFNLSELFDYEKYIDIFRRELQEAGWSTEKINDMLLVGSHGTLYERKIPHNIKEMGSQREWRDLKFRSN